MPRKQKIDLEKVLACLDMRCPKCGRIITPAEVRRIDFERASVPPAECRSMRSVTPVTELDRRSGIGFEHGALEANMKKLPHVNFLPFRGRSYGYQSAFGIPVLVVGESHYNDTGRRAFPRSFTRDVMDDVISGEEWKFFTRVLETFCGEQAVDPETFWDSVAFYNFIQTVISKGRRPAPQMWTDAKQAFLEVLEALKPRPRLIAVFGYETWDSTPSQGRDAKPIIHQGREVLCYEFGAGDGWSLAPKLRHPSRGFIPKQWHPVVMKALARAGGHEFKLRRLDAA